jgi:alpha-ribazole phosphatase/probable phosphoglycerate mutase
MTLLIDYYVHGPTLDNERKCATGWQDISLSPSGIQQTKQAALSLPQTQYDAVYSSDLARARQSAEILFGQTHKIISDSRLRECDYGALSGKPSQSVNYAEHINTPFPEGESLRDVQTRMQQFLDEMRSAYPTQTHIALVAHRAPQLALEVIARKQTWETAITRDWREIGKWQLGWQYIINSSTIIGHSSN